MSLRQFIDTGLSFCQHLAMHHDIEEMHIFPLLALRMSEFQSPFASQLETLKANRSDNNASSAAAAAETRARFVLHHRLIHDGMDELKAYLTACRKGERELEMSVMLTKMDSWGAVLWEHLDEEVQALKAENMRKYWSPEEMRRMPF